MNEFYETLMVHPEATSKEIKKSYKKLALKYHPDRNQGDKSAEEKFKEINEAYDILKDTEKRKKYDAFGTISNNYENFDPFERMPFGFDDFFRGSDGPPFGQKGQMHQGETVETVLNISLTEAFLGVSKNISIQRHIFCLSCSGSGGTSEEDSIIPCQGCKGRGQVFSSNGLIQFSQTCTSCSGAGKQIKKPCMSCHGGGRIPKVENISIKIPAGVSNGNILRLTGKGYDSKVKKGISGDLHVCILIKEHDTFTRHGDDLHMQKEISYTSAILGGQISVPTIDGESAIIALSQSMPEKYSHVIQEKGMVNIRTKVRGKQIITFKVQIPKLEELSLEQRVLIGKLHETFL